MIREIWESIQRRKLYSILIILLVSVFLVTVFLVVQTMMIFLERESTIESFKDLNVYKMVDTLESDEEFQSFLQEPGALERVKDYYTQLNESLDELYLYVFQQPVEVENIADDIYLEGYDEGEAEEVKNYGSPYPVKTVQINEQALDMFQMDTSKGNSLSSDDFTYQEGDDVPVLLGADYQQQFDVGDSFKASYIFKDFDFVVKGFLKERSFVERPQFPEINLERTIVMPAMEFQGSEDEKFQLRHYMQLINGAVYSKQDRDTVDQELQQIQKKTDFTHSSLLGESTTSMGTYFDALEQHKEWLIVFATILFLVCVGGTSMMISKKVKESSKNIMIHLISGGTMRQISKIIYGEIVLLILIPTLLFTLSILIFMPQLPLLYPLIVFMAGLIVMITSIIPIYTLIKKTPISQWLKRGE